jgi:hypothetical protein
MVLAWFFGAVRQPDESPFGKLPVQQLAFLFSVKQVAHLPEFARIFTSQQFVRNIAPPFCLSCKMLSNLAGSANGGVNGKIVAHFVNPQKFDEINCQKNLTIGGGSMMTIVATIPQIVSTPAGPI